MEMRRDDFSKKTAIVLILSLLLILCAGCEEIKDFPRNKQATDDRTELVTSDVPEEAEIKGSGDESVYLEAPAGSGERVSETKEEDADANSEADTDYAALSTDKTITIYDIEDGYMEVPYYSELPQCEYDWSYLKLDGQILHYDDPAYETTLGIDVSKFQGDIDWDKIKGQGFDFVMIRLGYRGYGSGGLVTDERFEKNIRGAQEAGLETGVYFLSQALNEEEAVEEAEYTLKELKRCAIKPVTYPVVVDSEKIKFDVSRTESMNGAERTDTILAFHKVITDAGYDCALYANSQWLTKDLDIRRLTDVDIWYADYQIFDNDEAPLYPYPFIMWQYTNKGKADGIDGDTDINIFFRKK
ncbi:MAG: hypothetical protein K6G83_05335 [Lachnospiraceae bacterium]|nr:hypothetical protein [Lachnospiraceae bacterium]